MPFEFTSLDIPGPILVEPQVFTDDRGFFLELYKHSAFAHAGIPLHFVQDNYSRSTRNVLRGLHYQTHPKAQGKLVRCLSGSIYDVAVDIRIGSPWYGKWIGVQLSDTNRQMLYVPPGFAHGFLTLSETADILYKCTEEYSPENDQGIIWNDPNIGIHWNVTNPLLSRKDSRLPGLHDAENNVTFPL